jgi:hypothetical protein
MADGHDVVRQLLMAHFNFALEATTADVQRMQLEQAAQFDKERAQLQSTIDDQENTIGDLSAQLAKVKIEQGGSNKTMDMVRDKLAATFGLGQSATKTKHLHTRILLYWRAYAKGKGERKKLYHVARAIFGRSLKMKVMNAWIGYFTGTSRDKERQGSQVRGGSVCFFS